MKLNKKIVLAMASLGVVATLAVGGTLAYFTDQDGKTNVLTLGKVDISLVEESESGKASEIENGISYKEVMPGDSLDKDVNVVVADDSRDAYIAVKVVISGDVTEEKLTELEIADVAEGWSAEKSEDGLTYFYTYVNTVAAKDSVDVFDTVKVPATWGNEEIQKGFTLDVTAYAIQAENIDATNAITELKKLAGLNE